VLKPDGYLLLTTPDTSSAMARLLGRHWPSYSSIHHLHLFERRNLERLLRQEGFDPFYSKPLWKTYLLEYVRWILQHQHPGAAAVLKALPRFLSQAAAVKRRRVHGDCAGVSAFILRARAGARPRISEVRDQW
jgi:hypothetical protein